MICVIKGQFFKRIIGLYSLSFSYNSIVKFHDKKKNIYIYIYHRSHNMAMLYQDQCYNEVFYKETALWLNPLSITSCMSHYQ